MASVDVMLARAVSTLPVGDVWAYEPKLDGFRALLTTGNGGARLMSRRSKPLTSYFPEIVEAARSLPAGLCLDGELVVPRGGGVDFAALQGRIHPAAKRVELLAREAPASLVTFDVLTSERGDVRALSYDERRSLLIELLAGVSDRIGVMPATCDPVAAQGWMKGLIPGVEGCVAKRREQRYRAGVRAWQKVRIRHTSEGIIGGVLGPIAQPQALLLGRVNTSGRLRMIGRSATLTPRARAELAGLLTTAPGAHPWPDTLPSGRFGQIPGGQIAYTQVAPSVVVEFEHDLAAERGRFRHAVRIVRIRPDLEPADLEPWSL